MTGRSGTSKRGRLCGEFFYFNLSDRRLAEREDLEDRPVLLVGC